MALNFNLFISASAEEALIKQSLIQQLRDAAVGDSTESQGMTVDFGSVVPPVISQIMCFQPRFWVSYRHDPNHPQFRQNENRMMKSALSLVQEWNAEAALVLELDKVIFRRRDGVVVLNATDPLGCATEWDGRLTVPHVLEPLPDL